MNLSKPLACLLLIATTIVVLLSGPIDSSQAQPREHSDDMTPIGQAMGELHESMRTLRKLAKTADDKEAALEVLRAMRQSSTSILGLEPPALEDQDPLTGDDHAIWVAEYRRHLVKLIDKLLELEIAVLRGHMKQFADGYSELSQIRNSAHIEYQ